MAKLNLSLENVKEEGGSKFSKIPPGVYPVVIESVEVKDTQKGGHYLQFSLQVVDGDHAGKCIADRVNINIPDSPKATEIGLGRLKRIAICSQVKNPNMIADTDDLLTGKMFKVETHLTVNKYEGKDIELSEVKKYLVDEEATTQEAKAAPKSEVKSSKKPWEK